MLEDRENSLRSRTVRTVTAVSRHENLSRCILKSDSRARKRKNVFLKSFVQAKTKKVIIATQSINETKVFEGKNSQCKGCCVESYTTDWTGPRPWESHLSMCIYIR